MARVLLIEDDSVTTQILDNLLNARGFNVTHFDHAEPALASLQHHLYDLILLDVNLPDEDGLNVLKRIRQELRMNVPVIMLTALTHESVVIEALDNGANDYISKPFSPGELISRMNKYIGAK